MLPEVASWLDEPFGDASVLPTHLLSRFAREEVKVVLGGADAVLELLDGAKKPTRSFVVGQPLTVRVTDADVNLGGAKKGKTTVTLRSASGDVKALALEETAPGSGVFVGSMPTRLRKGGAEKAFEVLEGENIVVEYLDALRSNGRRNVLLQAQFKAVAPGASRR